MIGLDKKFKLKGHLLKIRSKRRIDYIRTEEPYNNVTKRYSFTDTYKNFHIDTDCKYELKLKLNLIGYNTKVKDFTILHNRDAKMAEAILLFYEN